MRVPAHSFSRSEVNMELKRVPTDGGPASLVALFRHVSLFAVSLFTVFLHRVVLYFYERLIFMGRTRHELAARSRASGQKTRRTECNRSICVSYPKQHVSPTTSEQMSPFNHAPPLFVSAYARNSTMLGESQPAREVFTKRSLPSLSCLQMARCN